MTADLDGRWGILNLDESAILAFGQVRPQPWGHNGAVAVREVTQLAMSPPATASSTASWGRAGPRP